MEGLSNEDLRKELNKTMRLLQQIKEYLNSNDAHGGCPFNDYEDLYFIDDCGEVACATWYDDNTWMEYINKSKNLFKTEKEAERKLAIENYLMDNCYQFTQEEWKNEDIIKYFIEAQRGKKKIELGYNFSCQSSKYYFKTEEDCLAAIDYIGYEDYVKYILCERGY